MVINFNLDLETKMQDVYKSMLNMPKEEERKELSPNEFWNTMNLVSQNKQAFIKYRTK